MKFNPNFAYLTQTTCNTYYTLQSMLIIPFIWFFVSVIAFVKLKSKLMPEEYAVKGKNIIYDDKSKN